MNTTPIPDRKAASRLGVSYATIRNAADRGDLTRFPMTGQLQHVIEEQVMLFEGMSRIIREKLPPDKLKKWHDINDAVLPIPVQQEEESNEEETGMPPFEDMFKTFPNVPKEIWAGLAVIGAGALASQGSEVPQDNPFPLQKPKLAYGQKNTHS